MEFVRASDRAAAPPVATTKNPLAQATMTTALIEAGGKSQRMRSTWGPTHKALVPVLGVPILERNLCQLLAAGFKKIVVATSAGEPEIADYVATRGAALAGSRGASLSCFVEPRPLGTIGAAATLEAADCPILVVYCDNLTSLDCRALVAHHEQTGAAMTLATHAEPFRIPFGEVIGHEGRIVDYREKSVHPIRISSGTYVLGPAAHACITRLEKVDSPELVHRVLGGGGLVADYPHEELWIDVNDAARLAAIERLIAENPRRLDWLSEQPDRVGRLTVSTFGGRLNSQVSAASTSAAADSPHVLAAFDEIDPDDGKIARWHVELVTLASDARAADRWIDPGDVRQSGHGREARALAYALHHLAARSTS